MWNQECLFRPNIILYPSLSPVQIPPRTLLCIILIVNSVLLGPVNVESVMNVRLFREGFGRKCGLICGRGYNRSNTKLLILHLYAVLVSLVVHWVSTCHFLKDKRNSRLPNENNFKYYVQQWTFARNP